MKFSKNILLTALFGFNGIAFLFGQGGNLDGEIGFQYVKAEYLFETSRYEECITEFNQVILKNPAYKDALVKRAIAKYQMAAYKGAKMDAIQSIDLKGITATAAFILAKAENALGNSEQAINSLSAAIGLEQNVEYLELRASLYEKDQLLLKACQDYNEAAKLGSSIGVQKSNALCGGYKQKPGTPVLKPKPQMENTQPTQTDPVQNEPEDTGSSTENEPTDTAEEPTETPVDDPTIPKEDDFRQMVEIDEELSIDVYGQGLGRRKITVVPSILIIADETGTVTLDICVNNLGEVTKAEFNGTMSTIAKKSMVNLALRKAKEFTFEKSVYTNQCGYMVFKVKAN
jgi:tetratricopeptide (TPR) repeat protein